MGSREHGVRGGGAMGVVTVFSACAEGVREQRVVHEGSALGILQKNHELLQTEEGRAVQGLVAGKLQSAQGGSQESGGQG